MGESAEQVKLFANGLQKEFLHFILNELFYDFKKIIKAKKIKKQKTFKKLSKTTRKTIASDEVNIKKQKVQKENLQNIQLDFIDSVYINEDLEKINKLNEEFRKNKQLGLIKENNKENEKKCYLNANDINRVNCTDKDCEKDNQDIAEAVVDEIFNLNFIWKNENNNKKEFNSQKAPSRKSSVYVITENINALKSNLISFNLIQLINHFIIRSIQIFI